MKKNLLQLIAAVFITGISLSIYSCSKDEDTSSNIKFDGLALHYDNFKGDITNGQSVTLDPTKTYQLTGNITIKNGGKLIIPAGTKIFAKAGASSYILVEQGGQIFANGTAGSPIIFSSSDATPGSWGGLVICGKAPINSGTSANSEILNSTYGGTEETDNSGVLSYIRIEFAGATSSDNKKFNALSLFGIGNKTKLENIALVNSSDDGIEIFGGTVSLSYIVSISNENNAFVWTQGWKGSATNIFTRRKTDGSGNLGIKGYNSPTNEQASPRSNPSIKNITLIGGTTGESDAVQLQSGTYASFDNVVLSNWKTGFNIKSDSTVNHFNAKKRITKLLFENITNELILTSSSGVQIPVSDSTYIKNTEAKGAGNKVLIPSWAKGWSTL